MGQNRVKPPPPSESLLNRARLRTAQRHGTPFAATVGPPRDETSLEKGHKIPGTAVQQRDKGQWAAINERPDTSLFHRT